MLKRIYINKQIIARNRKTGEREPPISVRTYKELKKAHEIQILGEAKVVYSPDKPQGCGAVVWIETEAEVKIS